MRSVVAVALALTVGLAVLSGCGSTPEKIDATGTDGLTVPTPSPDPDDFVSVVDNRWFPLAPGTTWTYEVSGSERAGGNRRPVSATTTVTDRTRQVAGVPTVVVRQEQADARGRVVARSDSYFAQDRDGNVWIFGTTGPGGWLAGQGRTRATLVMAAAPRHGDGYPAAYVDGVVTRTAEVLDTDSRSVTPAGVFDDVVQIEEVDRAGDGSRGRPGEPSSGPRSLSYAPGVGLVEVDSGELDLDLVEVTH
ncbi:hypothetical protein [Nocardioides jensenii]|uniref:hypothetical protein n=1 Tax=Nocardioides jensenii TaxID=1843 RepID=UPI000830E280|nr:hypothetical protein [Nocardioides jensenii]